MVPLASVAGAGFSGRTMSELPDCFYCRKDQRLHDLMIEIAPLAASTLFLFREQTHPGRCVVAYRGHVNELFELPAAGKTVSKRRSVSSR